MRNQIPVRITWILRSRTFLRNASREQSGWPPQLDIYGSASHFRDVPLADSHSRFIQLPIDEAMNHIAGYTCFNDGSVRDYQKFSVTAGKNFTSSGSMGTWLSTADEIGDPTSLEITTRLNATVVQKSNRPSHLFDSEINLLCITVYCAGMGRHYRDRHPRWRRCEASSTPLDEGWRHR